MEWEFDAEVFQWRPLKVVVRRAEQIDDGDVVHVHVSVGR
jgi:hypothetical protein